MSSAAEAYRARRGDPGGVGGEAPELGWRAVPGGEVCIRAVACYQVERHAQDHGEDVGGVLVHLETNLASF